MVLEHETSSFEGLTPAGAVAGAGWGLVVVFPIRAVVIANRGSTPVACWTGNGPFCSGFFGLELFNRPLEALARLRLL